MDKIESSIFHMANEAYIFLNPDIECGDHGCVVIFYTEISPIGKPIPNFNLQFFIVSSCSHGHCPKFLDLALSDKCDTRRSNVPSTIFCQEILESTKVFWRVDRKIKIFLYECIIKIVLHIALPATLALNI